MKRNILFAIADDASHFGCYGDNFVNTPNIDALAEEGVIINNAFTCNPKCAPSRASILTGKYSWQLEDACNHFCKFPKGYKFIPDYLDEAGYHTGFTGKGWAPGDYSNYSRNPAGNAYNKRTLIPPEGSRISSCDYYNNFVDFIDSNQDDKPFFFWFGCHEPHRPYNFGEGIKEKDLGIIDHIPAYWPDCPEVRTDLLDYAYEINWFDDQLGLMIKKLKEIGQFENTLIIVTSDNGCPFPRVKGQMYEQAFHLPMVACCKMLNEKGGFKTDTFVNFVDILPTILELAGIETDEKLIGKSFLDIIKSPPEAASNHENIAFFGREKHDNGRENDLGYPVRCIRDEYYLLIYNFEWMRYPAGNPETGFTNCDSSPTKDKILELYEKGQTIYYDLSFGKRPQIELYDIRKDPECIYNLAEDKNYRHIKQALLKRLFDFLIETEDPRILIDKDYFDKLPLMTDGCDYSWQAYVEGRWKKQPY